MLHVCSLHTKYAYVHVATYICQLNYMYNSSQGGDGVSKYIVSYVYIPCMYASKSFRGSGRGPIVVDNNYGLNMTFMDGHFLKIIIILLKILSATARLP